MNKIHLKGVVCASALATAAFAAIAQDIQPPPPQAPAVVGTTPRLTSDASSSVVVKLEGARVIDIVGQPLGRIENIVLSPVGCAEAAILTAANGRLIPIPWTLVRVSGDTRVAGAMPGANLVFTVNVEQTRLAQAPSFARTQFPDMSNQNWLQASINFFGTASAVGGTGGGTNVITGAGAQSRFGTTATGGTNQSRFGTTATGVPTNSTSVLPPTGRPNPGQPDLNQPGAPPPTPGIPPGPPENRPPDNRPPPGTPPGAQQPPPGTPPPSQPPGSVPPARPSTQP